MIVKNQVNWNNIHNNLSALSKIPESLIEPYAKVSEQIFSETEPRMVNVRSILKRISLKNGINNEFKYQMMEKSLEAMEANLETIVQDFSDAFSEYRQTFIDAMGTSVESVDDSLVWHTHSPDTRFPDGLMADFFNSSKGNTTCMNHRISKNGATANNNKLCAALALAEVLINSDVTMSQSFLVNGGGLSLIDRGGGVDLDGHRLGAVPTCFYVTKMFQGVAHLINKFKSRVGTNWSKTLIHVGGEFNRSANISGAGSDHGGKGSCATLITGIKPGEKVLGEIDYTKGNESETYKGIWGQPQILTQQRCSLT